MSDATEPSAVGGFTRELYFWFKAHMNYSTLVLLMAIESSIVPLPSEVVVPPAAYFSLQSGSDLNFWMVILAATVGAYIGSIINYGLSVILGRPIIYAFAESRMGHALRLSSKKLQYAETFFQQRGSTSIFVARLLPVVRHLISIPAGLARMNFMSFSLFTVLGAGLWNVVLAALGYLLFLVVPDDALLFDQLEHYSHYLKMAGFALLLAVALYIFVKYRKKKSLANL
ncbi:MAG: DedA family protein [Muribaculaceae bacterium]|nr:DedA family protein [Muribaculaceae bacterium]